MNIEEGKTYSLRAIGVVHSPYGDPNSAPFQGRPRNEESTLEVFESYGPGLKDIERCSHLIVLYWQHLGRRDNLQSRTPWGPDIHGVFATRSPNRPNPIGMCVVELLAREGRSLRVKGMDAVDGSPVIDIKPYSSGLDAVQGACIGWAKDGDIPGRRTAKTGGSVND